MRKKLMGNMKDGSPVYEIFLENGRGISANVITYGAILKDLLVPDRNGIVADVVLGQRTLNAYQKDGSCSAAVIGRVANRIGGAGFSLNGRQYKLEKNDHGNCLHSGNAGYGNKNFRAVRGGSNWVTLYLEDMFGCFPGSASLEVCYCLTEDNALEIEYRFVSDEDTPVNLTNHAYFNLSCGEDATVFDHELWMNSLFYTPVDENTLTTGEIIKTKGTKFDFSESSSLGSILEKDIALDYNFVLGGTGYRLAAELIHRKSGRKMETYTDQPGIQVYTGNHFDGTGQGKGETPYIQYAGICLETQSFPNAINYPHFPSCVVKKHEVFRSKTAYRFSTI